MLPSGRVIHCCWSKRTKESTTVISIISLIWQKFKNLGYFVPRNIWQFSGTPGIPSPAVTFWATAFISSLGTSYYQTSTVVLYVMWLLVAQTAKNLPVTQETWVQSLVGTIPWRRKWQPTPIFLPGKFHVQTTLVSYSPWGCEESHTTEQLKHTCTHTRTCTHTYTHTHTHMWFLYFDTFVF